MVGVTVPTIISQLSFYHTAVKSSTHVSDTMATESNNSDNDSNDNKGNKDNTATTNPFRTR